MGLDLYHLKATLTPQDPVDGLQFEAETFGGEALDLIGFRRFLQTIPDTDFPTRVVVTPDQTTLEHLLSLDSGLPKTTVAILVGRLGALATDVDQIEEEHRFDREKRMTFLITKNSANSTAYQNILFSNNSVWPDSNKQNHQGSCWIAGW